MRFLSAVCFLALCTTSATALSAPTWNATTLSDSKNNTISAINRLIEGENPWARNGMSQEEANEIRAQMVFSGQAHTFDTLDNRTEILAQLSESLRWTDERIPLLYLISQAYNGNDARSELNLYQAILENDRDSAAYAFAQLDQLNQSFNGALTDNIAQLWQYHGFTLRDIYIDHGQDRPDICLDFSQPLRGLPAGNWQQSIEISPAPVSEGRYLGDQICYRGQYQQTYDVTINGALESNNDLTLGDSETRTINTGDRDPMIRFGERGKTLSNLANAQNIAIESSNVDRIDVDLWLIPQTNLSNTDLTDAIEHPQDYGNFRSPSFLDKNASKLYSGFFTVSGEPNTISSSNIAFTDMVEPEQRKPGVYILRINNPAEEYSDAQIIGFTVSDYGLTAYSSDTGLWIDMRRLDNAKPATGQEVILYAYNNSELGRATTDDNGMAAFTQAQISGTEGDRPSHLVSSDDSQLTYLNLRDSGYDLSDKGLDGKIDTSPLPSWAWIERGIYRPDDTLHALWLVKNPDFTPYQSTPLWLTLRRPDDVALVSQPLTSGDHGSYQFTHTFSPDAPLGLWTLSLTLGEYGPVISEQNVRVDAIVPQQIEARLQAEQAPHDGQPYQTTLQADWLYGAAATDMPLSNQYRIEAANRSAFADQWKNWQIGRHDEQIDATLVSLPDGTTDDQGRYTIRINRLETPFTTAPLVLTLKSELHPLSGQSITASDTQIIERDDPYIALQAEQRTAHIASLNSDGNIQPSEVHWQLSRLTEDYYWYYDGSSWQYQANTTSEPVSNGNLSIGEEPAQLSLDIDDGLWLLEVEGDNPQTAASLRIAYGEQAPDPQQNGPQTIRLTPEKTTYSDGDTVRVQLQALFDGSGNIHLAQRGIIATYPVTFRDGQAELEFPWQNDWQSGIWLLASGWNQDQNTRTHRAVGLTWLGDDLATRRIPLTIDSPDIISDSEQPITITVHTEDADNDTLVNIAVIDDGLYQLAKATFTDPLNALFGKKQLNISFHDVWGSIIRQIDARQAALRSGAGADEAGSALEALPDVDVLLLSKWSGPLSIDEQGNATYQIDIPQTFNGRLRVMAAAYNGERTGHSEQTVTVKTPLISELYTPRFLSPGDQGTMRLRLHNTTDQAQTYTYAIDADQGIEWQNAANHGNITLNADSATVLNIPYRVSTQSGTISINANIDDGSKQHVFDTFVDVRPLSLPIRQTRYLLLDPQSDNTLMTDSEVTIAIAQLPWQGEQVRQALNDYPYYCSEQTASKINGALLGDDSTLTNLIARLQNKQQRNGGFSLWSGGESDLWLSAYSADTLAMANPDDAALTRSLSYLNQQINQVSADSNIDPAVAYAHYVLARHTPPARNATQGALIRYSKSLAEPLPNNASSYELAIALLQFGETRRAEQLLSNIDPDLSIDPLPQYADALSNQLHTLARIDELLNHQMPINQGIRDELLNRYQNLLSATLAALQDNSARSTQTLAWMARLSKQQPQNSSASATIDGQSLAGDMRKFAAGNHSIANPTDSVRYAIISDWRTIAPDSVEESGWRIHIDYYDEQGNPVADNATTLNAQITAVVEMRREDSAMPADIIFAYPFAAGFSAPPLSDSDQALSNLEHIASAPELDWPDMQENRDDRHIAAFHLNADESTIHHAFTLQAARPGNWYAAGYGVEDMYAPANYARYSAQYWRIKDNTQQSGINDLPVPELSLQSLIEHDTELPSIQLESASELDDGTTSEPVLKLESTNNESTQ
ncbi:hypothetical protein KRX19_00125 [Cardiobacteriaceae bacterium TAE3-ERU3]|nr:hypothetical protein [Cardiobacteriaceae bacterium TAE3-ERU3]